MARKQKLSEAEPVELCAYCGGVIDPEKEIIGTETARAYCDEDCAREMGDFDGRLRRR